MKAILLFAIALCSGCAISVGPRGLRAVPVTPPPNAVVRLTVRSIGIHAGQNQATQTPELVIGYRSATYDRIPTGTNITVPHVSARIDVDRGSIAESIETGN